MLRASSISLPAFRPPCQSSTPKLLAPVPGWFFIQILVTLTSDETMDLYKQASIRFDTIDIVSPGLYKKYLTEKQITVLGAFEKIKIFEVPVSVKTRNLVTKPESFMSKLLGDSEKKKYTVKAVPNWRPVNSNVEIIANRSSDLFDVITTDVDSLSSDPAVLRVVNFTPNKLKNRYTNGFLRSGEQNNIMTDDNMTTFSPRRYAFDTINGQNQVVNVVDTGLDPTSPFFLHNNKKAGYPYGKTDMSQRKVVRYDVYGDKSDDYGGHGTHVAGIVAGEVYEDGEFHAIQRFNGIAHKAKLYIVDFSVTGTEEEIVGFDPYYIASAMDYIPDNMCAISSNSWGSEIPFPDQTLIYNQLAWEFPNQLYVFPAGNEYYYLNSPADSKSAIAVAATNAAMGSSVLNIMMRSDITGNVVIEGASGVNDTVFSRVNGYESSINDLYMWRPEIIDSAVHFVNISMSNVVIHEGQSITDEEVSRYAEEGKELIILLTTSSEAFLSGSAAIPVIATNPSYKSLIESFTSVSVYAGPDVTRTPKISVTDFSSKGPSAFGTDGPTIAVPGGYIWSAQSNPMSVYKTDFSRNILVMVGTSMAAPAAAGFAALVRQWLIEKQNVSNPASYLMRAIIINNAQSIGDARESGYGVPCLQRLMETPTNWVSDELLELSHIKYSVTVKKATYPLSITLSYLDAPLDIATSGRYPLFLDLDLTVIDPNGKTYHGNGMHDAFSTNEKIVIDAHDVVPGVYEIHVTSSAATAAGSKDTPVPYSIVISGNVDAYPEAFSKEETVNSCTNDCYGHGKCVSGQCVCSNGYAGSYCEIPVTELHEGDEINEKFGHKDVHYYLIRRDSEDKFLKIKYSNNNVDAPILHSVYVCLNVENATRIADPNWTCDWLTPSQGYYDLAYEGSVYWEVSPGKQQFGMAMWCVSNSTCDLELKWDDTNTFNEGFSILMAASVLVISVALIVIIVVVVAQCKKGKIQQQDTPVTTNPIWLKG